MNVQPTTELITPSTDINAEENNTDQADNVHFESYECINPFCTPVQEVAESSSRNPIRDDEAEMKKHMEIVQDDKEIEIDAIPLAANPPMIFEYKIVKEGHKGFYHLIRADGSSNRSVSTSTHPIIIISDSNVEDAFSSTNTPDYTLASPDYFPASPGNTSFDPLEDLSKDLLASLAISPFHDDLYMKVMQAYNDTNDESPIPPP
ncbi:hypothetical protein Tco_1499668 [Tanacetum coccineum]